MSESNYVISMIYNCVISACSLAAVIGGAVIASKRRQRLGVVYGLCFGALACVLLQNIFYLSSYLIYGKLKETFDIGDISLVGTVLFFIATTASLYNRKCVKKSAAKAVVSVIISLIVCAGMLAYLYLTEDSLEYEIICTVEMALCVLLLTYCILGLMNTKNGVDRYTAIFFGMVILFTLCFFSELVFDSTAVRIVVYAIYCIDILGFLPVLERGLCHEC